MIQPLVVRSYSRISTDCTLEFGLFIFIVLSVSVTSLIWCGCAHFFIDWLIVSFVSLLSLLWLILLLCGSSLSVCVSIRASVRCRGWLRWVSCRTGFATLFLLPALLFALIWEPEFWNLSLQAQKLICESLHIRILLLIMIIMIIGYFLWIIF